MRRARPVTWSDWVRAHGRWTDAASRSLAQRAFESIAAGGWSVLLEWDRDGPPAGIVVRRGVYLGRHSGLVDHPYRLVRDGETVYVSEPYAHHGLEVSELCAFTKASPGWRANVGVFPAVSLPGPRGTVSIAFTKAAESASPTWPWHLIPETV